MSMNHRSPKIKNRKVKDESESEKKPKKESKQLSSPNKNDVVKRRVGKRGKNFNREIQNIFKLIIGNNSPQRMAKNSKEFLDKFAKSLLTNIGERILLLHSVSKGTSVKSSTKTLSVKYVKAAIFSLFDHEAFTGINKFAEKSLDKYAKFKATETKSTKGNKNPKVSIKEKTDLALPTYHVSNILRKISSLNRIGTQTIIYTTAVVEYCLREIIEDAIRIKNEDSGASKAKKNKMIIQKYTAMALYKHTSLRHLFWNSIDGLGVERFHHLERMKELRGTEEPSVVKSTTVKRVQRKTRSQSQPSKRRTLSKNSSTKKVTSGKKKTGAKRSTKTKSV